MDTERSPAEAESTLEFILNTLCRALNFQPRQAAAVLTNNNQFLTKICMKGVKGRYEPLLNWYAEIYQYSRFLSGLLQIETQTSLKSADQKKIQQANANFSKVLQTITCGCLSHN